MTSRFSSFAFLIFFVILLSLSFDASAREYVTFESFYKESTYLSWMIAGAVAIVAGAVIFFTGGTASPIVVSMGTWVGGMMGLSGAAATNAGLALLGGGSIAAGGFGVLGGTAVLTAALTFGTEIVFDYTISEATSTYDYSALQKQSETMLTLPIPLNEKGTEDHKLALQILSDVEAQEGGFILTEKNRGLIEAAIGYLEATEYSDDPYEKVRQDSLLALLHFILSDFISSNEYAIRALDDALSLDTKDTLPSFIYATSQLYLDEFDYQEVVEDFSYSVMSEPKNPLIPLLFTIYLDRAMLRFNDGALDYRDLDPLFVLMQDEAIEKYRLTNYTSLISRLIVRLKLEQQKIVNLTSTSDLELRADPRARKLIQDAMTNYSGLLGMSIDVLAVYFDENLNSEARSRVREFMLLLFQYSREEERLESLVASMGAES